MENLFTNFGVQIGFKALTPTKMGFCKIPPPFTTYIKHVFEQNSAPNYFMMTKLHIGQLDLNTKKPFSAIF